MKKFKKLNLVKIFLIVLSAIMLAFGVVAVNGSKAYAYNSTDKKPGEVIENLYRDDGTFNEENLDNLAKKINASYTMDDLVAAMKAGTVTTKTSKDFGNTAVKFGKYTNKATNTQEDLVWIPAYLSKAGSTPILTLWLSNTENGLTKSDQEYSYFAEGTAGAGGYNTAAATSPSSNNYSTSYIRSVALNNGTKYVRGYNNSGTAQKVATNDLVEVTPAKKSDNKFAMFTTGDLANYIVTPRNVSWQANAGYSKNDPKWTGGSTTTYPNMDAWLDDKLWLPSVHEVFDEAPSSSATSFTPDSQNDSTRGDGLWQTDSLKRANDRWTWLRSGYPTICNSAFYLVTDGSCRGTSVDSTRAVRPALHLNLESAAQAAQPDHEHNGGDWKNDVNNHWKICSVCNEEMDKAAHTYGDPVTTKDATCDTAGTKESTCAVCGYKKTETIPAKGHTLGQVAEVAATCNKTGTKAHYECSVCKKLFADSSGSTEWTANDLVIAIDPDNHDWATGDEWTSDGSKHWYACKNGCGNKSAEADHNMQDGEVVKAATCTDAGSKKQSCTICGYDTTVEIPASGHDYDTTVWNKDETYHWHDCKNKCGSMDSHEIHTYGEWTEVTKPTEVTEGLKKRSCTVCAYEQSEKIDPLSHTHTFETTWTSDGTYHWHAATCQHTDEVKSKSEHTWDGGTVTTPATCVEQGLMTYTCTVCQKTKTEPININSEAHEWSTVWSKDATSHWHACVHNSAHKNDVAVHNWGAGSVTKAATCTEKGVMTYTCTVCGQTKTEDIAINAAAHDYATAWSKDETNHWHACTHNPAHITGEAAHEWDNGVITQPATETAKGVKTYTCTVCSAKRTEDIAAGTNVISGLTLEGWTYGEVPNSPSATATYGKIQYSYSNEENGEYTTSAPVTAGTWWVKATVLADPNGIYGPAEAKISFEIAKRDITVAINAASSEQGKPLEALTATVTSGSIASGDSAESVYKLKTTADAQTINSYPITGESVNENYNIHFVEGVYMVSKREQDPSGGGSIDLPDGDANVAFKVTQSETSNDYSQLKGMKVGYWAQLWERNDGELGDEYTGELNCILTLKIPTEIIEAIRGGEEIDRDKIAKNLSVYCVTDGEMNKVEAFRIAQREDESWIVKFNYNSKFRAEVVFNAENVEEPAKSGGIPWWVWLIVGLGGATLIAIIVLVIVVAKKKSAAGNDPAPAPAPQVKEYDDAELKAQLAEQRKLIDELANRDDGGFNDVYKGE